MDWLTLQIVCNIVITELKNPTWKTGNCRSMKPKCPGQSFNPLLQVIHVASFWLTPCTQKRLKSSYKGQIIIINWRSWGNRAK